MSLGRGRREPGMELRNHSFREPALCLEGFGNMRHDAIASHALSRRSRRPRASVDDPCTRTGRARGTPVVETGRSGKAEPKPDMHDHGKSDIGVVLMRPSNKAIRQVAETE
jgi:hypothetical protein